MERETIAFRTVLKPNSIMARSILLILDWKPKNAELTSFNILGTMDWSFLIVSPKALIDVS